MTQPLELDQLVEAAQQRTGLTKFDAETFREALGIFLKDFNRLDLPERGIDGTRETIVAALSNRLRTTAWLDARPELLTRPVSRPVFVFGIARTGTTLLNNLLAADPNRRSPLSWEIDNPVPAPTTATLYNDPRALKQLEAERALLEARPDMGKYYRFSAIYPNECLFFMGHDFKNVNWEARGRLPNYRDYLFADSDIMRPAYAYHKRYLQLLQSEAPGIWNLKMPSHGMYLDVLLETYPDARLIWTHRDPLTAVGSFCSLIDNGGQMSIGWSDPQWIGENMPWQAVETCDRIMDFRDRHGEDRVIDSHYADLMRDPIPAMRQLYAALGDEFTPEAEAGMRAWLADNPQRKFGRHSYKLDAYGLTPETLRPRFDRYLSRYSVETEG